MPAENEVLLVTIDESLSSEVLRLAAAAGVQPRLITSAEEALASWGSGAAILVGADLAGACAALTPPRRPGVQVLTQGAANTSTYAAALALSAEGMVDLSLTPNWLLEILSNLGDTAGPPGLIVGILGGCGGAGASVFATALAQASSRSRTTLLIDADQLGTGIERILGQDSLPGARWDALSGASGRLSGWSLRDSLPSWQQLSLLCFPNDQPVTLDPASVRRVLEAARRGFDLVVVDLPRQLDPVSLEVLARSDQLLLVLPMTFAALAAGTRVSRRLPDSNLARQLIARGSGLVVPDEAAATMGLPLLAAMPNQRGLDEDIYLGAGPLRRHRGPLNRTARAVVEALVGDR
ncbi:MAG TPA: septum site determining protein [Marmoricola sp.]|nr:septum site determining protein [Marmoricola sp.]HNJ78444.1 septum site determining protein [Marmoricola sp.]HNN47636.1 septum site determining protein [Marmoricola sp.]